MKVYGLTIRACALIILLVFVLSLPLLPRRAAPVAIAEDAITTGTVSELSLDDGETDCIMGPSANQKGQPGFGWANRLTPASYPATLRSITVGFNRRIPDIDPDEIYRIAVFIDPEMDGPSNNQIPVASFLGGPRGAMSRPRGSDAIVTFNLITPIRIEEGSFVVAVLDIFGVADFPAFFDIPGKSDPPGSDSFTTTNGGESWRSLSDAFIDEGPEICKQPGSFLIRATVEGDPADTLLASAPIKDPLAVEPWSVCVNSAIQRAVVTNYVSDNLTIINTTNQSFQNVAAGDGPGGAPDGPFGVVCSRNDRFYITLFGSNTIPSKEFPLDPATLDPGRVLVTNNAGAPLLQIIVGRGPMFPAILPDQSKIYVPCAGENRVDVISTTTNQKIAEIPVGDQPSSCAASFNGSKVYVTNFGDGTISVIDPVTDQRVKTIAAPTVPTPGLEDPPLAANPWQGAISPSNGNLYVTYWGTDGGVLQNGAIVEIDACTDEVVGVIIDDATNGTPSGSAGATGLPAPTGPLARDGATGTTIEAGGGGGGPFGIAFCRITQSPLSPAMYFTNDGRGIFGAIDSRIDQLVSVPPINLCVKPRGIDCARLGGKQTIYIACGQPESCVLVFTSPGLPENLGDVPVIESVEITNKLRFTGRGFLPEDRVEVFAPRSRACLTFSKRVRLKKEETLLLQKGRLNDGRRVRDLLQSNLPTILRLVSPEGTARISLQFAQAP